MRHRAARHPGKCALGDAVNDDAIFEEQEREVETCPGLGLFVVRRAHDGRRSRRRRCKTRREMLRFMVPPTVLAVGGNDSIPRRYARPLQVRIWADRREGGRDDAVLERGDIVVRKPSVPPSHSPPKPAMPHPLSNSGMKNIMHKLARSQYPSPTVLSSQSMTATTLGSVG